MKKRRSAKYAECKVQITYDTQGNAWQLTLMRNKHSDVTEVFQSIDNVTVKKFLGMNNVPAHYIKELGKRVGQAITDISNEVYGGRH